MRGRRVDRWPNRNGGRKRRREELKGRSEKQFLQPSGPRVTAVLMVQRFRWIKTGHRNLQSYDYIIECVKVNSTVVYGWPNFPFQDWSSHKVSFSHLRNRGWDNPPNTKYLSTCKIWYSWVERQLSEPKRSKITLKKNYYVLHTYILHNLHYISNYSSTLVFNN